MDFYTSTDRTCSMYPLWVMSVDFQLPQFMYVITPSTIGGQLHPFITRSEKVEKSLIIAG